MVNALGYFALAVGGYLLLNLAAVAVLCRKQVRELVALLRSRGSEASVPEGDDDGDTYRHPHVVASGDYYDVDLTAGERERSYVTGVLDEACDDLASYFAAEKLEADVDACQVWMDRVWDGLRANLEPEQRLHAIVLLLTADGQDAAAALSTVDVSL